MLCKSKNNKDKPCKKKAKYNDFCYFHQQKENDKLIKYLDNENQKLYDENQKLYDEIEYMIPNFDKYQFIKDFSILCNKLILIYDFEIKRDKIEPSNYELIKLIKQYPKDEMIKLLGSQSYENFNNMRLKRNKLVH